MGTDAAEIDVDESVTKSLAVLKSKTSKDSGKFLSYTGEKLVW